ncbi:MAG: MBL fold metallo-hydrolase [Pseudomonadales bacterium]|jgi:glyoxylase-like metal-dependent hydrolase (beta-lactamase superfamily II)|nr:MBL fold metallo-hydrolase [Pseudomonadales bacterium]
MATQIPFVWEYDFEYATLEELTPLIRRVTARNPSGFTFHGTGTYVIGRGNVAVIDPGPLDDEHIEALKASLAGETVTHILITHTHFDHSPAAAPLKEFWGTKTYGFGPHGAGKAEEGVKIEEGGDMDFVPDVVCRDGDMIEGDGWTIECVHTPGHTSNHLCFALKEENALFTGDHVMGWSTSVIGPPDGDMTAYMESLEKLLKRDEDTYWPTHGTCIKDVKTFVQAFIDHRLDRERQILECLGNGYSKITDMVPVMYTETDKALYPAAAHSVLAAMIRMIDTDQVTCDSNPAKVDSTFTVAQ